MKNRVSRTLSLLLAALMLSMTAASCSTATADPEDPAQNAADTEVTAAEAEAAPEEEEDVYVTSGLPARDFDGETFTFYARMEGSWAAVDLLATELTGEQINDAVYQRTVGVEDTYNLHIAQIESPNSVVDGVKTLVSAGDQSFQCIVSDVYDSASLSTSGMLRDLNKAPNIDLTQRWWAQQANESMSLLNKQFYATGDIFIIDNKAIRVMFFNKGLIADLGLENPYGLTLEGTWDYDHFFDMCEAATADLDGDGAMNRKVDRFGLMGQSTLGEVLLIASGETMIAKDENDYPYISCSGERAINVMTTITEKIAAASSISQDGSVTLGIHSSNPDNIYFFMEGRALFAPEVLLHIETFRDSDVDVGILPPPKFEEAQQGYYCYTDGWCVNVVSIPSLVTDMDKISYVLEVLAADSLNNLTPAYYEVCLTKKYVRDQESVAMLDLILASAVMDNANIFSWGGLESTINSTLTNNQPIVSAIEKVTKATNKTIEKAMQKLEEIEG